MHLFLTTKKLKIIISLIISCCISFASIAEPIASEQLPQKGEFPQYIFKTWRKSYFQLSNNGDLIPEIRSRDERFYKIKEGIYHFSRKITSKQTALVVMDPWADAGSEKLNQHFGGVYRDKILPVINQALHLGFNVIVLTNDPKRHSPSYGAELPKSLMKIAGDGMVTVLYHIDYDDRKFEKYLKSRQINSLIYTGFASNMCVIGVPTGMIPMYHRGFKLFFIPEASAAVEFGDSWARGDVHEQATSIISQWVAEIINFEDFMKVR